jgi:hypothetical protein
VPARSHTRRTSTYPPFHPSAAAAPHFPLAAVCALPNNALLRSHTWHKTPSIPYLSCVAPLVLSSVSLSCARASLLRLLASTFFGLRLRRSVRIEIKPFVIMELTKRYCERYLDGTVECFRDGFWYSDVSVFPCPACLAPRPLHPCMLTCAVQTGIIVKWAILASFFFFFLAWFLGGYIHAKARLRKGKPLLAYHRVRPPSSPLSSHSFSPFGRASC